MKNAVSCVMMPSDSCKNRRFVGTYVPSSLNLFTLIMQAVQSAETSVLTRALRPHIPKLEFFIVTAVKTSNLTDSAL
jgi:hypothetical protein